MAKQTPASKGQKEGSSTIASGTRLTIENAADFAKRIGEALVACKTVAIALDAKAAMDVTTLQVLCSACKTATAEGKSLTPQGAGPESLRQLIVAAGAQRHGPCQHNNSNPCLWFGGEQ